MHNQTGFAPCTNAKYDSYIQFTKKGKDAVALGYGSGVIYKLNRSSTTIYITCNTKTLIHHNNTNETINVL